MQDDKEQPYMDRLLECFRLLAVTSSSISLKRKEALSLAVASKFKPLCAPKRPVTGLLLGDDLAREMKEIQESYSVGSKIMQTKDLWTEFPVQRGQGHGRGRGRGLFGARGFFTKGVPSFPYPQRGQSFNKRGGRGRGGRGARGGGQTAAAAAAAAGGPSAVSKSELLHLSGSAHLPSLINRPSNFVAGKTRLFRDNWLNLTSDRTILKYTAGVHIDFIDQCIQTKGTTPLKVFG